MVSLSECELFCGHNEPNEVERWDGADKNAPPHQSLKSGDSCPLKGIQLGDSNTVSHNNTDAVLLQPGRCDDLPGIDIGVVSHTNAVDGFGSNLLHGITTELKKTAEGEVDCFV